MPVDKELSGFEYDGPACSVCGRPHVASVGPLIDSIRKPPEANTIFTADKLSESIKGRRLTLFCSDTVAGILSKAKLSGMEIVEAV